MNADIRAAMATSGPSRPLTNPLVNQYTFQTPTQSFTRRRPSVSTTSHPEHRLRRGR